MKAVHKKHPRFFSTRTKRRCDTESLHLFEKCNAYRKALIAYRETNEKGSKLINQIVSAYLR